MAAVASTSVQHETVENALETVTKSLKQTLLSSDLAGSGLIDTPEATAALVDVLYKQPTTPPSLYIDLEGINLSRHGTISILQIFVRPLDETYLVDIHTLGYKAFDSCGADGGSLRKILESEVIPKVFFDVRNDSDALFSHFQINLAGIQDLQLMELATRSLSKRLVNGLSKCLQRDISMGYREAAVLQDTKERGLKLFAPERGGSYEVFNERPLAEEIRLYCIQDVKYLSRLWTIYDAKLTGEWRERVLQVSRERVASTRSLTYNGVGRHMACAPRGWENLR